MVPTNGWFPHEKHHPHPAMTAQLEWCSIVREQTDQQPAGLALESGQWQEIRCVEIVGQTEDNAEKACPEANTQ